MVDLSDPSRTAIRDGLLATKAAIEHFREGCRALEGMPEGQGIRPNLRLAVRRLDAMEEDLESRLQSHASYDSLFIALHVAQASMSSLTDALGEMREACYRLHPHVEPEQGRFIEEGPAAS